MQTDFNGKLLLKPRIENRIQEIHIVRNEKQEPRTMACGSTGSYNFQIRANIVILMQVDQYFLT